MWYQPPARQQRRQRYRSYEPTITEIREAQHNRYFSGVFQVRGVPGYEDSRFVSDTGGVARMAVDYTGMRQDYLPLKMKWNDAKQCVTFQIEGKTFNLAETILTTFVRPKQRGEVILYRDGNKQNCALVNLQWHDPSKIERGTITSI